MLESENWRSLPFKKEKKSVTNFKAVIHRAYDSALSFCNISLECGTDASIVYKRMKNNDSILEDATLSQHKSLCKGCSAKK